MKKKKKISKEKELKILSKKITKKIVKAKIEKTKTELEFKALYMKNYRLKRKVKELNQLKPTSWKSKRSKLYKEIVENNKKLKNLAKKRKINIPKRSSQFKSKLDFSAKTRMYTMEVWKFEGVLNQYIKDKQFKKIIISGKKYYVNKTSAVKILFAYDDARENAYAKIYSTTPHVEVTEDYGNSELTINVVS